MLQPRRLPDGRRGRGQPPFSKSIPRMAVCSFCNGDIGDDVGVLYRADNPAPKAVDDIEPRRDWRACTPCAGLVDTGQWSKVIGRALEQSGHRGDREMRQAIRASLKRVFAILATELHKVG